MTIEFIILHIKEMPNFNYAKYRSFYFYKKNAVKALKIINWLTAVTDLLLYFLMTLQLGECPYFVLNFKTENITQKELQIYVTAVELLFWTFFFP